MKGAVDGGLNVPHEDKRFPGFTVTREEAAKNKRGKAEDKGKKTENFEAKVLRSHIFGCHVQSYYDQLKKEDKGRFTKQFSRWEKCLAAAKCKNMEELYTKCHAAIRAKPAHEKKAKATKVVHKLVKKGGNLMQDSKGNKWRRDRKGDKALKAKKLAGVMAGIRKAYGIKH